VISYTPCESLFFPHSETAGAFFAGHMVEAGLAKIAAFFLEKNVKRWEIHNLPHKICALF